MLSVTAGVRMFCFVYECFVLRCFVGDLGDGDLGDGDLEVVTILVCAIQ